MSDQRTFTSTKETSKPVTQPLLQFRCRIIIITMIIIIISSFHWFIVIITLIIIFSTIIHLFAIVVVVVVVTIIFIHPSSPFTTSAHLSYNTLKLH